jgi:hypothetical protein
MSKKYITLLDCRQCGIKLRDSKEDWVVTFFFDHEPSEVYGTFACESDGIKWAKTKAGVWGAYSVHLIRTAE